jgi:hypothetical protein
MSVRTLPLGKTKAIALSVLVALGERSGNYCKAKQMKRHGYLYSKVIDKDNIRLAYLNARKGKRHYREVRKMNENPEHFIDELHDMLASDSFKNSEYTVFKRQTEYKLRDIYKLPFYPDRIVHHCIVQVMQPLWMKLLIRDTYSTIPGRGIHDGVARVKKALKDEQGTKYCLKLDVKKFYPSVDHDVLKQVLRRKVKDERLMGLMNEIIDSAQGIPIGNYVSQWFGNIYLAYFDHYVKEELGIKYYFRYADDLVFLSDSKEHLWSVLNSVQSYLKQHLKLEIKSNYQVYPVDARGIDFLGYRFFHGFTLVRKRIVRNFKRKIKGQQASKHVQSAYWGWFKHADTNRLTNKYFKNEREQQKSTSASC